MANDSLSGTNYYAAMNSASAVVCLLAVILVFALKLFNKVVYRLALYQVLASLALALVSIVQTIIVLYNENPEVYGRVCTAIGWLALYTQWMKLLFTMWVTVHLFCFAVLHKNLKKLEVVYIVTSILIPAIIACVPLITNTYGLIQGGANVCYIKAESRIALIETFALWSGPAMVVLLAASMAMLVTVIVLCRVAMVCSRCQYEPIREGDQYWNVLKQLLPLAAFPMLFFLFEVPL